jgi:hypothetical protein
MNIKFSGIIIFLLLAFADCYSQKDSVVQYYEMKGGAGKQIDSIHSLWMSTHYPSILKRHRLKMQCSNCESIYMNVQLDIDSTGKVFFYKIIKEKCCAGKFSDTVRKDFLKYFLEVTFPDALRRKKFIIRLGTGLKC